MSLVPADFKPPHCPRSDCRYHKCADGWDCIKFGSFTRRAAPQRIQRFRCVHCRATFSTQTFSTSYYLKRPDVLTPIAFRVLACSGYRQMARETRCSHTTIMGQVARLGRHALLLLEELRPQGPIREPFTFDGFESFAYSQYHPLHLNLGVGSVSHYTYGFTFARLRRKGRMTENQKRRRSQIEATHGRPDPKAIEKSVADLFRISAAPQEIVARSDEHPAYPRAFRHLPEYTIHHEMTSSLDARTPGNPLFPVNHLDQSFRHNSANHKRETIAFSKRHQGVIERAAWLLLWQNWGKHFSDRAKDGTPAMRLGLTKTPWSVKKLLTGRRFVTRIALPKTWQEYYRRKVDTPGIQNPRRHTLKLAV